MPDPQVDKQGTQNSSDPQRSWADVALALINKFTRKNTYWWFAALVWSALIGYLFKTGRQFDGFPTIWDLRGMFLIDILFFGLGWFLK